MDIMLFNAGGVTFRTYSNKFTRRKMKGFRFEQKLGKFSTELCLESFRQIFCANSSLPLCNTDLLGK